MIYKYIRNKESFFDYDEAGRDQFYHIFLGFFVFDHHWPFDKDIVVIENGSIPLFPPDAGPIIYIYIFLSNGYVFIENHTGFSFYLSWIL